MKDIDPNYRVINKRPYVVLICLIYPLFTVILTSNGNFTFDSQDQMVTVLLFSQLVIRTIGAIIGYGLARSYNKNPYIGIVFSFFLFSIYVIYVALDKISLLPRNLKLFSKKKIAMNLNGYARDLKRKKEYLNLLYVCYLIEYFHKSTNRIDKYKDEAKNNLETNMINMATRKAEQKIESIKNKI